MFRFDLENYSVAYATEWKRIKCDPQLLKVLVQKAGLLKTPGFVR